MARSQVGEWVDERGTYRSEAHATAAAGQGRGGKVREGLLQQRASLAIAPTVWGRLVATEWVVVSRADRDGKVCLSVDMDGLCGRAGRDSEMFA